MKVSIKLESCLSTSCGSGSSGYFELLLGTLMKGEPGKSAYDYAVEAGYTGTEEEYAQAQSLSITRESNGETGEVNLGIVETNEVNV